MSSALAHNEPRPPGRNRRVVARFAAAVRLLEHRRVTLDRLRTQVTRLAQARLVPVVAEEELGARLKDELAEASAEVQRIASGTTEEAALVIGRLEQMLNRPEWLVADEVVDELAAREAAQLVQTSQLTQDLNTLRLRFDKYRREVEAAFQAGAEVADDRDLVAEVDGRIRQAEQDAGVGRFDTVAVAVRQAELALDAKGLGDPDAFEARVDKINAGRVAAERHEGLMSLRSELVLIVTPDVGSDIEYTVLLRRPSFEATQESNLHDTSRIHKEDREQFRGTVDRIAERATAGIRAAMTTVPADPPVAEAAEQAEQVEDAAEGVAAAEGMEGAPTVRRVGLVRARASAVEFENADPVTRLERVGRIMYSLLIPDGMQRLIDETTCALTVTSNDFELPWELMHDGEDFLCLKRPFARMPVGQTFPRRARRGVVAPPATWRVLLIHSDPDGNLRDAGLEIDEIEKTLKALPVPVTVRRLGPDEATTARVTEELSGGEYDLIHYAGHAGFDTTDAAKSYLLLAGHKPFLAERIQRVLEGRPVVFLNACDTSRAVNEQPDTTMKGIVAQAQGLASAFVYGGAHACVGALWPVFDDTARQLAATFYTRLLARRRVGEALREARLANRNAHTDRVTWAAYALYGDPLYRLTEGMSASTITPPL
jgi:hypothetical protein